MWKFEMLILLRFEHVMNYGKWIVKEKHQAKNMLRPVRGQFLETFRWGMGFYNIITNLKHAK